MGVSLAVTTQYTNVTDRQTPHDGLASRGKNRENDFEEVNIMVHWAPVGWR